MTVKEKISLFPHSPGVYRYYDAGGNVIYVGKAKDLHKRVAQYFVSPDRLTRKTAIMVSKIADAQYSVVDSEADALLLENNLIKQYKPRYNILLKDSKTYPWICVSADEFPKVFLTRRMVRDGSRYFGPYSSVMHARNLLELFSELYPLRSCNLKITGEAVLRKKFRPCLNFHIGRCRGCCVGGISVKEYNDNIEEVNEALSDLSLTIEKGSFVCVLGHNGSGKSTFAKLLNGLQLPKEGTILISGMDTRDDASLLNIRRSCGMVFQNPDNQIIANVVEEDVAFGPENLGVPTDEIIRRVDEALSKVGMEAYRLKSPNRLSGGQKQRVAIAGVMAMKPECIVLDEPTAMLDPSGRRDVMRTVRELNKREGITIVHITHYMEEAVDADRIIVMDDGKIVMDGAPRDIFSRVDELKELSLDVPQMTELAYELRKAGLPLPLGILTREELLQHLLPLIRKARKERGGKDA